MDLFNYHANDGTSDSNIVSVAIDIYLNHAPAAIGDIVTVVQGSGYTPDHLLTNDNAANPDAPEVIKIVAASHPVHGSVTITGGGTGLSYRPGTNYTGSDTFTYTISDGVFTSSASVLVNVPKDTYNPVATAPVQSSSAQTIGTSTVTPPPHVDGHRQGLRDLEVRGLAERQRPRLQQRSSRPRGHHVLPDPHRGTSSTASGSGRSTRRPTWAHSPTGRRSRSTATRRPRARSPTPSPWTTLNSTAYSGGHARGPPRPARCDLHHAPADVRLVSDVALTRGTADVYVDGVLAAHLTLTQSTTKYRYVAYSTTFASSAVHSMRIVYTGAADQAHRRGRVHLLR